MRQYLLAIFALLSAVVFTGTVSAQERNDSIIAVNDYEVSLCEGELFAGMGLPVETYHGGNQWFGLNFGLAYRVNIPHTKFDCGIQADFNAVFLRWKFPEYELEQVNPTLNIMLTGAYNFRQGHTVNPFAGIGMGVGFMYASGNDYYPTKNQANFVFSPRIGCEFWGILRVYASSHIIRKGFNSIELGIGLVIGGWRKKCN